MSDRDPFQTLWTQQNEEPFSMSLADIHQRAERFQSRIQLRNLIEYAASALVIAGFAYFAVLLPDPIIKTGCVLIILGALYVCWKLATLARATPAKEKAGAQSWADFHRAELVRQRDALRSVWSWYLAPFVPGMLVFLAGVAFAPPLEAPLAARLSIFFSGVGLMAAVYGVIYWINLRAAKSLGKQIEALDRAREN